MIYELHKWIACLREDVCVQYLYFFIILRFYDKTFVFIFLKDTDNFCFFHFQKIFIFL